WDKKDPDVWPMEVIERGGKFYMFYAAVADPAKRPPPAGCANNHFIGLAIASNAEGPFVDIGRPLMEGTSFKEGTTSWADIRTLDPNPFVDNDGSVYLYWSKPGACYAYSNPRLGPNTNESHIYGAKLTPDLMHLATDPKLLLRPSQDWEYRVN